MLRTFGTFCKFSISWLKIDKYFTCSLFIHIFLLSLLFYFSGETKEFDQKIDENKTIIVLDSIEISEVNNVKIKKTDSEKVENKQKSEKKFSTVEIKPEENKKDVEAPKKIEEKNEIIEKKEIEADVQQIYEPKSKPTQPVKEQNVKARELKEDDDLASLLKTLDEEKTKASVNKTGDSSGLIGKGEAVHSKDSSLSVNIVNSIRSQFIRCWNVPIGAAAVENFYVVINIELDEDGRVTNAIIKNDHPLKDDTFYRIFAESALRAVHLCNPLINLPKNKYKTWQHVELTFHAKDMI